MTVVSALSPLSLTCFFYDSGELVRPARAFFYKPNTEDPVTVYTDPTLGVPYTQPVLSGGSGRVPPIYIGTEPYRVRVYDTYGALIEDIEYLPGAAAVGEGGGGGAAVPGTVLQTGDMFHAFAGATTQRTGCVRANGGIISSVGFDATPYPGQVERLAADTHDLFVWLWGQDFVGVTVGALAILPSGRGSSAESDWSLNKGIRLPDLRGRTLVGLDGMGMASSALISPIVPITPSGQVNSPGTHGGVTTVTQTAAQMPAHGHGLAAAATGLTITNNGTGIGINGAIANLGSVVAGIVLNDPAHLHTYPGLITNGVGSFGLPAGANYIYNPAITTNPNTTGISLSDPGHIHPQSAHVHAITDIGHAHGVTDPTHIHSISATGGGAAMPTISPFSLVVVYIKL